MTQRTSAEIRRQLKHPIVDADGHWLELQPVFVDYIAEIAGPKIVDRYNAVLAKAAGYSSHKVSPDTLVRNRIRRQAWWTQATGAKNRATYMVPAMLYQSLDEWGIDVSLLYPTLGFLITPILREQPDLQQAVVRAYNIMVADLFKPYGDRLIPAASISLDTPNEAIELLEHAKSLGLKSMVMNGTTTRPIEGDADFQPDPSKRRFYYDAYGLDSPYDYDPVWKKCVELGVAVTVHTGTMGWPDRSSPSSFVFNHMGHFAQSHHLTARSLFMGGVTQRFPTLNFGFLEGGVGWACNLYGDLISHWKKRDKSFMEKTFRPDLLDRAEMRRIMEPHVKNNKHFTRNMDEIFARGLDPVEPGVSQEEFTKRDLGSDDFARVKIANTAELRRLYANNFYFGCEADDPMTMMAFHPTARLKLKAMLGSDIGHFDVVDPAEVMEEAWEMVDHGLITESDFREFTFSNVVEMHGQMNADFFRGTLVEVQAKEELRLAKTRDLSKVA
jgi:predicted TIM-barrel fold metal-dependent hydrolase